MPTCSHTLWHLVRFGQCERGRLLAKVCKVGGGKSWGIHLCPIARAAITECHRLGGISHNSGGSLSKIKMSAGLVSSEVFLFSLQMAAFSLCSHVVFPRCVHAPGLSLCVQTSSSCKDASQIGLVPTLTASF